MLEYHQVEVVAFLLMNQYDDEDTLLEGFWKLNFGLIQCYIDIALQLLLKY